MIQSNRIPVDEFAGIVCLCIIGTRDQFFDPSVIVGVDRQKNLTKSAYTPHKHKKYTHYIRIFTVSSKSTQLLRKTPHRRHRCIVRRSFSVFRQILQCKGSNPRVLKKKTIFQNRSRNTLNFWIFSCVISLFIYI